MIAPYKPPKRKPLTPGERRVLVALLNNPNGISREDIDRIAPASNGSGIIARLRHKRVIRIITRYVSFRTKDGAHSRYGVYVLPRGGRLRAELMLKGVGL